MDWERLKIAEDSSIRGAIERINEGAIQIGLVVDKTDLLLGTVTDGDIRRAILGGKNLEDNVVEIMSRNFTSVSESRNRETVLKLMRRDAIHHIPVVDHKGKIIGLHYLDELVRKFGRPNPVVLMAGGRGIRLRPLTEHSPKPMLHVGSRPILEIILENFVDQGFQNFYFSINYLKNQIKEYFGTGEKWGVAIDYLEEENELGTAGALSLLPVIPTHPVVVMNGDVLTSIDFDSLLKFHEELGALATIGLKHYDVEIPYGVVSVQDNLVTRIVEKPVRRYFVNAGIYVLNPSLLKLLPEGIAVDMPTVLDNAMEAGDKIGAFPLHEYWLDIGQHDQLEKAKGVYGD